MTPYPPPPFSGAAPPTVVTSTATPPHMGSLAQTGGDYDVIAAIAVCLIIAGAGIFAGARKGMRR